MVLRIGYVREHFSSPLLQLAEVDNGKTIELVECPSGTGQVITRLVNDEIDVAIALTDPLLAGIAKGTHKDSYKVVGSYVATPLNWAVITGKDSKYNSISDLRGTKIGISRIGSGSQTMASVMALQQGWVDPSTDRVENIDFQVNNDITGLNASVNDGSTSAFMWEWFTTKPWLDKGEIRFIGSVPTPWPSWTIVAHPSSQRADPEEVKTFLDTLTTYVREFNTPENREHKDVEFIKEKFGYPEADIREWLATCKWVDDTRVVRESVLRDTLSTLRRAGVVGATVSLSPDHYVHKDVAKVLSLANDSAAPAVAS